MDYTVIESLRTRLAAPLPGREAQYRMASMRRLEELGFNPAPPPDARIACVLNLLSWKDDAWHTLLIQRTQNPNDRHSGQVSFPGGRYEENDGALQNVALRETFEEVGIPPDQIEILGRLTELYIPVSNHVVHPFVGLLKGPVTYNLQPSEVAHVLQPSIDSFHLPENRKTIDLTLNGGVILKDVPYFDVEGRVVWGATAMIMSEFLEVWRI
jgi:8-oxo-dGTP pyrophosphatase MutT (NUDIX family)